MDNLFSTDFNNHLYTVEIEAVEGGIRFHLKVPTGKPHPTFQEVVGALEYMKVSLMLQQREGNYKLITEIKK